MDIIKQTIMMIYNKIRMKNLIINKKTYIIKNNNLKKKVNNM